MSIRDNEAWRSIHRHQTINGPCKKVAGILDKYLDARKGVAVKSVNWLRVIGVICAIAVLTFIASRV